MSPARVIEAQHYRDEVERLKADPIIQGMLATVRDVPATERHSWPFISAASGEYMRRGGTGATSIGGPSRAINALIEEAELA
jgi:hypothetical protein